MTGPELRRATGLRFTIPGGAPIAAFGQTWPGTDTPTAFRLPVMDGPPPPTGLGAQDGWLTAGTVGGVVPRPEAGAPASGADDLCERNEREGGPQTLAAGIEALEQALAASPEGSPDQAGRLSNLGNALRTRYEADGRPADLYRAVALAEQALASTPKGSPDQAGRLSNLGNALHIRYKADGRLADLDRAIALAEQALTATPEGSPDRASWLNNLGIALRSRYAADGKPADLDRGIALAEQALAATPEGSPDRATLLNNLGTALLTRYEADGKPADLDRGIALVEQALAATPEGGPDRTSRLNNLGNALRARYAADGKPADLDRAIALAEQALAATSKGSPDQPGRLSNLGNAMFLRFRSGTGGRADQTRTIQLYREALLLLGPNDSRHKGISRNLELATAAHGGSLQAGAGIRLPGGLSSIIRNVAPTRPEQAASVGLAHANRCFDRGQWAEAAETYAAALSARRIVFSRHDLPDTAADRQAMMDARAAWQRDFAGAGARAALAFRRAGVPDAATQALLVLENGLEQGFQDAFDLIEIDLNRLRMLGHGVSDRFREARQALARLTVRAEQGRSVGRDGLQAAERDYDAALAAIRAIPGFQDFLAPASVVMIRRAAAAAPLVYLAATPAGGLALAVPDATGPLQVLDLTCRASPTPSPRRSPRCSNRPVPGWTAATAGPRGSAGRRRWTALCARCGARRWARSPSGSPAPLVSRARC